MKIKQFITKSPIVPTLICSRKFETELHRGLALERTSIWEALILTTLFFEEKPCRPSHVAKELKMSRSQFSQTIKRMEKDGTVSREISSMSARCIDLSLTSKGRKVALRAIKAFDQLSRHIDHTLGVKESEQISRILLQLTN